MGYRHLALLTHATSGTVSSTVTETTTGAGGEQREIETEWSSSCTEVRGMALEYVIARLY